MPVEIWTVMINANVQKHWYSFPKFHKPLCIVGVDFLKPLQRKKDQTSI